MFAVLVTYYPNRSLLETVRNHQFYFTESDSDSQNDARRNDLESDLELDLKLEEETGTKNGTPATPVATVSSSRHLLKSLERGKTSVRNAFRTVASTAKLTGADLKALKCSMSTTYRKRVEARTEEANEIRQNFKPKVPLTVNFDGIEVPPLVRRSNVKRLPTLVTGTYSRD